AGGSAFGVSGPNAHVLVEAPPAVESAAVVAALQLPWVPVLLSGTDAAALRAQAQQVRRVAVRDLHARAAAGARRAALADRAVVLAGDTAGLTTGLGAVASGSGGLTGVAGSGRVACLFTGQGAQRESMGRGWYEAFPVFADA
ncbi:polyketide synthase, partial [Streptomyces sp. BE303]|nr:polyketide synthase [Streptomyces sp. BE303]